MKTTYIDRSNTNRRVIDKAKEVKNPKHIEGKNILTFNEYVNKKQNELMAHTIRADDDDPLRGSTLIPGLPLPISCNFGKRRVGRPRASWAWDTLKDIYIKTGLGDKHSFKIDPYIAALSVGEACIERRERH